MLVDPCFFVAFGAVCEKVSHFFGERRYLVFGGFNIIVAGKLTIWNKTQLRTHPSFTLLVLYAHCCNRISHINSSSSWFVDEIAFGVYMFSVYIYISIGFNFVHVYACIYMYTYTYIHIYMYIHIIKYTYIYIRL